MKTAVPSRLRAAADRVVSAPTWIRYGLLFAFGACQFALGWWLLVQDLQQSVAAQGPLQELEQTRLAERLAGLRRAERDAALSRLQQDQLAGLESELPDASAATSSWARVHQASEQHGLRMALFKPGPLGVEQPYPEQRATVRLSGSFAALLGFAQALAQGKGPVAIESFSLTGGQGQGGPNAAVNGPLVLEAVLLSLHQPARTATAPSASASAAPSASASAPGTGPPATAASSVLAPMAGVTTDPFESQRMLASTASTLTASSAAGQALRAAPLSTMRMVGSVRAAEQSIALLMVSGTLHAVRVGDALGNAHGRVAAILADRITVNEPVTRGPDQTVRPVVLLLAKD